MNPIDEIFHLFKERGQESYFGEPVSQLEHALQCADFAIQGHASNEMIAAALLHDVGHLLHQQGENIADQGIDAAHEDLAQSWLSRYFGAGSHAPYRLARGCQALSLRHGQFLSRSTLARSSEEPATSGRRDECERGGELQIR